MKLKKENLLIILSVVVLAVFLVNMFSGNQSANDNTRISELIYTDFKHEVEIPVARSSGDRTMSHDPVPG